MPLSKAAPSPASMQPPRCLANVLEAGSFLSQRSALSLFDSHAKDYLLQGRHRIGCFKRGRWCEKHKVLCGVWLYLSDGYQNYYCIFVAGRHQEENMTGLWHLSGLLVRVWMQHMHWFSNVLKPPYSARSINTTNKQIAISRRPGSWMAGWDSNKWQMKHSALKEQGSMTDMECITSSRWGNGGNKWQINR